MRAKSLSYTAECMGQNRTFRRSECFYFTVQFRPRVLEGWAEFDFRVSSCLWGSQWVVRSRRYPWPTSMLISHRLRQMGPVCQFQWMPQLSDSFSRAKSSDLNILRRVPCGTEHSIFVTFPVIRKWWKILFHIKNVCFSEVSRATMATLAETASLGCIIKTCIIRAFSLSLPSN